MGQIPTPTKHHAFPYAFPVRWQSSLPSPINNNLPKPLIITDLSPTLMHGSQLSVAYQGVSGAYSEATIGKASPKCQAIPCDQFEVAWHFKQWSSGSPIRPSCPSRTHWG
uniref:Prephenate dehydratase domain-containing protein n=1 Tax=Nelumbo nucifera TaxID=4432 RepID=A0A822YWE3_NELNU|nr:TPA_asm: hypothetical protein HUJ06_005706 [Nelumbo nucifera]